MYYVAKDKMLDFPALEENVWIYASSGIFLTGSLTAFAALRLAPARSRRRYLTYTIRPISIAPGLANIAHFFVLTTLQTR